jgi:hypothetical protein
MLPVNPWESWFMLKYNLFLCSIIAYILFSSGPYWLSTKQFLRSYMFRLYTVAIIREPQYYKDISSVCTLANDKYTHTSLHNSQSIYSTTYKLQTKLVCGRTLHAIYIKQQVHTVSNIYCIPLSRGHLKYSYRCLSIKRWLPLTCWQCCIMWRRLANEKYLLHRYWNIELIN